MCGKWGHYATYCLLRKRADNITTSNERDKYNCEEKSSTTVIEQVQEKVFSSSLGDQSNRLWKWLHRGFKTRRNGWLKVFSVDSKEGETTRFKRNEWQATTEDEREINKATIEPTANKKIC